MLITERIENCTAAIKKKRTLQEQKQSAESYASALTLLDKANQSIQSALSLSLDLKTNGLVDNVLMNSDFREELLECANKCGQGVFDGTLTADLAEVLKSKGDNFAAQLQLVWKDSAVKYSDNTKGYLSMLAGLSSDPKHSRDLVNDITTICNGPLTQKNITGLVSDVKEAKAITDAFSVSPEIELFLKKVSSMQASIGDLNPNVLSWLREKGLMSKLKVCF